MWDSQENLSEFDKFLIKTNKIGAKSLDELFRKERMITNKKALELGKNPIKGNFDYQHLKESRLKSQLKLSGLLDYACFYLLKYSREVYNYFFSFFLPFLYILDIIIQKY